MNNINLLGRLTRDPELRHTQAGTAVASFTIAVDRGYSEGGERKTDFIDCVAWKGTAEFIAKHFTKGQMIAVTGALQIRDWTDKDGNKRKSAEVIVRQAYFTGSKNESNKQANNDYTEPEFEDIGDDDSDMFPF